MGTVLSPRAGSGRGEEEKETKAGEDGGGGDFRRGKKLRMWREKEGGSLVSLDCSTDR